MVKTQSEITRTTMMIERPCGKGVTTLEIDIEGYVQFYQEKDYGSDADGNRGVMTLIVDDVKDIVGYDCDEEIALTPDEINIASRLLVERFLQR